MHSFDTTVKTYGEMYRIFPIEELAGRVRDLEKADLAGMFEVERKVNELPQFRRAITVSLYCQKADNQFANQYGSIEHRDASSAWYARYVGGLLALIRDFSRDGDLREWKLRIHLERQLEYLVPELVAAGERVEVYVMRGNSVGAGPGMSWRYLAFDDRSLEVAFVMDIDDALASRRRHILAFAAGRKAFGRYMANYGDHFLIRKSDPVGSPMNYAPALGGIVGFRPGMSAFCMRDVMVNFMAHRRQRITAGKFPHRETDEDRDTRYNAPIGSHTFGWGGHFFMYGFDEKMLKHTLFPYFAMRGELQTWVHYDVGAVRSLSAHHPCRLDYEFCTQFEGNEFCRI